MRQARNGEMSARATATAAPRSVRRSARGSPLAYLDLGRTHGDLAFLERTFIGAGSSTRCRDHDGADEGAEMQRLERRLLAPSLG